MTWSPNGSYETAPIYISVSDPDPYLSAYFGLPDPDPGSKKSSEIRIRIHIKMKRITNTDLYSLFKKILSPPALLVIPPSLNENL